MLEHRPRLPLPPPWREFASAPLVPIALAATLGLLVDRYGRTSFLFANLTALCGLILGFAAWKRSARFSYAAFVLAAVGLAATYHHGHRNRFPADDIGRFVDDRPAIVRVRGILDEPPRIRRSTTDLFGAGRRVDLARTVLHATELRDGSGNWFPAVGRVQLSVEQIVGPDERSPFAAVRVGDEIEVTGQLSRALPPGNPGEWDYANAQIDQRIRGELRVTKADDAIARLDDSGRPFALLARLQGHFTAILDDSFPPHQAALARALLLGDGTAMDRDEWDVFARTGVIHVLAISGQHLVILAGFVWWSLRIAGVRRRSGTLAVIAIVVGYAILTGLRPSASRAAIMVVAGCGAILLRKPLHNANVFALAWLGVIVWNPTDPFTSGCQLSFLAVFILAWGTERWFAPRELTPMEQLIAETRSPLERLTRVGLRWILVLYGIAIVLTIANAPLIMMRNNLVPPIGVLLVVPLLVLTTIALLAGFLLLIVGPLPPLKFLTGTMLNWSDWLVKLADGIPGGSVYVPTPELWWVLGYYGLLIAYILIVDRRLLLALLLWLGFGLIGLPRSPTDELRVVFLSVGHGGCTVVETPDGRTFVYDVGAMGGPDVVRRVVAPYLWSRGIDRIDELFLSHADLDHYNGVPELLRRFPVGQVTLTPSFATKPTPEVADVLLALRERSIPSRVASAGDRFAAGDVSWDVLHPPREGPEGVENERSLLLRVRHGNHTFLLTGDLEKKGLERVLGLPPTPCDVLMAPHHGSRAAFSPAFAQWCAPAFVVVPRGNRPESAVRPGDAGGAPVWDTWSYGAITLRSNPTGLLAEAFRRGERIVIKRGASLSSQ